MGGAEHSGRGQMVGGQVKARKIEKNLCVCVCGREGWRGGGHEYLVRVQTNCGAVGGGGGE